MAQKNAKIDDVKRPEKVTPSATSRPILISGQASAPTDPMMVSAGGDKPEGEAVQVMSHAGKTITPPSELVVEKAKEDTPKAAEEAHERTEPGSTEASSAAVEESAEAKEGKPEESKPAVSEVAEGGDKAEDTDDSGEAERDPDAALSAEEAAVAEARAKREEELEKMIASGKYAVPIDAVQRRRSRLHTIILTVIALLLALALVDLVADTGIIDLPSSVPHTHFFSAK